MINKVYIKEKILELINGQPGISAPQVAEKMGLSRVTAFRHIKNLISLQKIRSQGQGKATRYFPHESSYIASNIGTIRSIGFTQDQVHFLKQEVLFSIQETYNESETEENLDSIFDRYCMYIAPDDTIMTGFDAFLGWCTDPKHDFSDRIVKKAIEYLEIIGSIEYRRKKNGFLDGGESARMNLKGLMDIAFD